MKTAFTLAEIVFIIIVLGILAAVAVPRYFYVEKQAQENIVKAFTATLYRTVGHSLWSKSISSGKLGSIKSDDDGDGGKFFGKSLEEYITIPKYFDKESVDFSNCASPGTLAQPFIEKSEIGEYNIFCRDGNSSTAPYFTVSKENRYQF